MQKSGAGLHTANSCYWDTNTDGEKGFHIQYTVYISIKCLLSDIKNVLFVYYTSVNYQPNSSRDAIPLVFLLASSFSICSLH